MRPEDRPSPAPQILPLVIAAFAGATLAIACERPGSRVANEENLAHAPRATQAQREAPAAPAATLAPAAPPRETITDEAITSRIRAAIAGDPGMRGADVSVTADEGAVTLVGPVRSHEQIAIASAHAQRQDGVTRVDNHLTVERQ